MKIKTHKKNLKSWLAPALLAICAALFVRYFLVTPLEVTGTSMLPQIHDHDELLIKHFGQIKRFDIITFKLPTGETYIKRVIGLPGDTLEYKNNKLYVDHRYIPEEFLGTNFQNSTADFKLKELLGVEKVPKDCYFVLGDNRQISRDSRSFGMVQSSWVSGKALGIYWPLDHIKIF
ncbi:signal peptidase I [Ligilactobacillus faecis]|uniref:signal peptidase I n=1 Tax=Ligilactobacillus faecis TaxID=762833 RepID=UPI0024688A36|nr:signal peptidase I [Ligilactobacillus faecis]WGN89178.1 signal peptidase I [Ligilactobacillus faecis]